VALADNRTCKNTGDPIPYRFQLRASRRVQKYQSNSTSLSVLVSGQVVYLRTRFLERHCNYLL